MLPVFEDYLNALERLHDDLAQAITGLPMEALDWTAGPGMNSLTVLVVHLTGAERYWIGDVAGEDPSHRDRAAEFEAAGWDAARLKTRLDATLARSRSVLESLTVRDLSAVRVSPRDRREYTVAWALFHALEHTALHLGHAQIVRQLWDQRG